GVCQDVLKMEVRLELLGLSPDNVELHLNCQESNIPFLRCSSTALDRDQVLLANYLNNSNTISNSHTYTQVLTCQPRNLDLLVNSQLLL
ncbi:unnamed protein product, partial [Allacma fusca]